MKRIFFTVFLIPVIFLGLLSASYAQYTILQLTDNSYEEDELQINDSGQVYWGGTLYDIASATATQIDSGSWAQLNDSDQIVWHKSDGSDTEIFLYDIATATTAQITNNAYDDVRPQINDSGQIVWRQGSLG